MNQRHLLTLWNPVYGPNVMEMHLDKFLTEVQKLRAGEIEEDDVYVWWGKVRSPHRSRPLPHLDQICGLDAELKDQASDPHEMHLYLTDYRSLFVAEIGQITAEDMLEQDPEHVPPYYQAHDLICDCWFRLWDLRRLVSDDLVSVTEELRHLRNARHLEHPVSIYGGMVDLPLIVLRPDGMRYFDPQARERLADGKYWAEFDSERIGVGAMERDLRENLFGDDCWRALDPLARTFVATGEKIFRDHRSDAAFDFTPVVVEFAKAFEVQCNAILARALCAAPASARQANVDGRTIDVIRGGPLSLGQLGHALGNEQGLRCALKPLRHSDWLLTSLPAILEEFSLLRNPAAHTGRVSRDLATYWRNQLLGVGTHGDLVHLAAVRPRTDAATAAATAAA